MDKNKQTHKRRILLATGGSGGHVSPSLSLAHALTKQGFEVGISYDSRTKHLMQNISEDNIQTFELPIHKRHSGLRGMFVFVWQILKGLYFSAKILRSFQPDLVVGFGSYASFPMVLIAMIKGMPLVLHEQNAVLGQVNRFAIRSAIFLAVSFENTKRVPPKDQHKIVFTGNPVRGVFEQKLASVFHPPKDNDPISIFIIAGSQGSFVFDRFISMGLTLLPLEVRRRLNVVQQVREENIAAVRKLYSDHEIEAELSPYFDDVQLHFSKAHLVVARGGSSTLFELLQMGRPGIIIPLKTSKDNHQYENAVALQKMGAALLIDQNDISGEKIAKAMVSLLLYPHLLERMHQNALRNRSINAAEKLASSIEEVFMKKGL